MKYIKKAGEVLVVMGAACVALVLYVVGVIISLLPYALAIYFFMWLFGAL